MGEFLEGEEEKDKKEKRSTFVRIVKKLLVTISSNSAQLAFPCSNAVVYDRDV